MAAEVVAVLGAGGTMGFPMARNLAGAGIQVRAWNRSREKAEPLQDDGVVVAQTPAQAAEGASVIVTVLADADAVFASIEGDDGALAQPGADAIWVQMSTVGETATQRCAELARERGVTFVDAPVLGTKQPAQAGELVVLASGPAHAVPRLAPVFEAIARKTLWVGDAGEGTLLKLVINSWIVAVVEGAAETLALAEGLGIDPALFLDAVEGGPLDLPYLRVKGEAMLTRSFEPSFRLGLAAKDARLVEEAAQRRGLDLPLLSVIRERLERGAQGHADEDISATYLTSAPAAEPR
jgi:3-hydroxyisobutyrate dehydrogenase